MINQSVLWIDRKELSAHTDSRKSCDIYHLTSYLREYLTAEIERRTVHVSTHQDNGIKCICFLQALLFSSEINVERLSKGLKSLSDLETMLVGIMSLCKSLHRRSEGDFVGAHKVFI
jgi:hypothetical protein